jgi:hypothetical protein
MMLDKGVGPEFGLEVRGDPALPGVKTEELARRNTKAYVFSRRADPRFGETVYRLTSITRGEPDPSLFQVPADYKQEDMKPLPIEPMVLKQ